MGEGKSWSQKSLDEAHQRKMDFEHGQRTGVGFNDESERGARQSRRERHESFPVWQIPPIRRDSSPTSLARPQKTSPATLKDSARKLASTVGVLFFIYALVEYPAWNYWQIGIGTGLAMLAGALAAMVLRALALFVQHVLPPLLAGAFLAVVISHFLGFDLVGKIAALSS